MEIIKSFKVRYLINTLLTFWALSWGYFMLFNWDIFVVKLNISLGFGIINSRPFVLFFVLGLFVILVIRYLLQYSRMLRRIEVKEKNNRIAMQEKDIEILKLKEMLYKEQSTEFNKTAKDISVLHHKIEEVARKFEEQNNQSKNP